MSKTLSDRKVNKAVKDLNKKLFKDVFGNRFQIRQVVKTKGHDGIQYYKYQLIDNLEPERNKIIEKWIDEGEILILHILDIEINDFIITSDFWDLYFKEHPKKDVSEV